jgi:phosphoglycolate phosphatase-like HAD superfamily hydrolase
MNKIIALDFDGVICDSINECLLVSYHAFYGKSKIDKIDFSDIQEDLVNDFKKNRYIVGPAKDFYFLWKSIIEYRKSSKEVINTFVKLKKLEANHELPYAKRFYLLRDQLKKKYYSEWVSLNPFYHEIKNLLIKIKDRHNLFIVTAKDTDSVSDLLQANNVDIKREQIYGREINIDKRYLFRKMINTRGLSQKDIIFIDDNISNLIDVNEIGISGFLATWGYNSDYDKNEAKKNDIIPIKLSDLQSIL